jgi:hypothetical protein
VEIRGAAGSLVNRDGRVAKAKVAGSNPVFRSNLKAPVLQGNLREAGAFVFL